MKTGAQRSSTFAFLLALHRYLGLAIAVFMILAAATGCLLTVRSSLDRALNRDLFYASADRAAAPVLAPIEAVARFAGRHPELQVVNFPLRARPGENLPVRVAARPGLPGPEADEFFLDLATGEPVGARPTHPGFSRRQFVPALAEFHFNLLAGDWGRWLMGVAALGWLVIIPVGLYLTLPPGTPFLARWLPAWSYSLKRPFARQMLDLHRASGLWLLPFVLALAFTSVALNFFSEVYEPVATTLSPLKRSLFHLDAPFPNGASPTLTFTNALTLAQTQAEAAGFSWRPATMLYMPEWNLYGVTFTENGTLNYQALGPIYLYFDAADGRFAHEVNPYNDSAGLVMLRGLYPLHSGEVGGPITVFVVFILGAATLAMSATGIWLWLKRRGPRIAAARRRNA